MACLKSVSCLSLLATLAYCVYLFEPALGSSVTLSLQRDHPYHTFALPNALHMAPTAVKNASVPAFGDIWPVSIYWVYIEVGTPPVSFPVAIDTGSADLDIPLIGCQGCPTAAPNQFYNPKNSSTSKKICLFHNCKFSNSYQTCDPKHPDAVCTISGLFYNDDVRLGGLGPVNITFGAINYQTSNFYQFQRVCGVVGLTSTGLKQDVFNSLWTEGYLDKNLFGLCLNEGSTSNGTLTLGDIDDRLYTGNIQYADLIGTYVMNMQTMDVYGTQIHGSVNQAAILDSGTNVLLLPQDMFNSLKNTFLLNCKQNPLVGVCTGLNNSLTIFDNVCFQLSEDDVAAYPNITMNLGGIDVVLPPESYLLYLGEPGKRCLGIINTGPDGFLIIGDVVMENYYIVYDVGNSRVGWAAVNKDNCGSI